MVKILRTGPLGVNSLVVELCENKVFIVDPACCEYCGDKTIISDYLKETKKEPVALVLTHGHFDHVAGLPVLKEFYPDIPVLIHNEDSQMIGKNSSKIQKEELDAIGFSDFLSAVNALPSADCFLEDKKTLFDCMEHFSAGLSEKVKKSLKNWKILHTPGHTMGSVCLYNESEKLLLSGDTVFYGSYGRTDLGGSEVLMMQSLKKLKQDVDGETLVYPGHDYCGFKMGEFFF